MTTEDKTLWQWGGPVEDDADGLYLLLPIIEKLSDQQLAVVYAYSGDLLTGRIIDRAKAGQTSPRTASQIEMDFGDKSHDQEPERVREPLRGS